MQIGACVLHLCRIEMPILNEKSLTRQEFTEGYFSVFIFVEDGDDSLDERVLVKFWHIKDFVRVQVTRIILVDLFEASVQLLDFFFTELAWKLCVTHIK